MPGTRPARFVCCPGEVGHSGGVAAPPTSACIRRMRSYTGESLQLSPCGWDDPAASLFAAMTMQIQAATMEERNRHTMSVFSSDWLAVRTASRMGATAPRLYNLGFIESVIYKLTGIRPARFISN